MQSQKGAELIWKYPILLDACANEVQRQGDAMMVKWAEVGGPGAARKLRSWEAGHVCVRGHAWAGWSRRLAGVLRHLP